MATILPRLAAVFFGLLMGILLFELGLRTAGSIAHLRVAEQANANDPLKRPIVAFCGDSNIYGVYVDKEETIAAALERLSRKGSDGNGGTASGGANNHGVRAINLGVPGHASWDILEQVQRALEAKPSAVVVTAGINNYSLVPTDEGLGILENLKVVKMLRRQAFNYKLANSKTAPITLKLGPDGKPIEGQHINFEDGKAASIVTDREGVRHTQFRHGMDPAQYPAIAARYRADLIAMAREARAAGTKLVFATYLAGDEGGFDKLSEATREIAASEGALLADCAKQLPGAVAWKIEGRISEAPQHLITNNRFTVLVEDRHPTAIGYEIEARVVANTLREAGLLPGYAAENPLAPLETAKVVKPTIRQSKDNPLLFEIEAAPGDRVALFFGGAGWHNWRNLGIPLEGDSAAAARKKTGVDEIRGEAGPDGKAQFLVSAEFLKELPKPLKALCVAVRGGPPDGAERRFLSPTIEVAR